MFFLSLAIQGITRVSAKIPKSSQSAGRDYFLSVAIFPLQLDIGKSPWPPCGEERVARGRMVTKGIIRSNILPIPLPLYTR